MHDMRDEKNGILGFGWVKLFMRRESSAAGLSYWSSAVLPSLRHAKAWAAPFACFRFGLGTGELLSTRPWMYSTFRH